jgi:cytoskeletal protein CcmA (bactofilin family)
MWNQNSTRPEELPPPVPLSGGPVPARPSEERRVVAWVGKSVLFRGDLIALEDMSIDGRVEGTIELRNHHLTIGPDAHIQADITATGVTVLGSVVGTITASDAVHIAETGRVDGNVTAPRLTMKDGAIVRGRVDTGAARTADPSESPAAGETVKHGSKSR